MQTTQKEWRPGLVALHLAYRGEEGVLLGARRPDGCFRGVSNPEGWWGSWGNLDEWLTGASCQWSGHPHWGDPVWAGTREEFEALRARAETPADLLRLAREAAAEQERDAVAELDAETETIWRSDFEELAYTAPGRTVLRFRGLDDVSLSDANARAMAAQILGGAEGVVPVADVKAALEGGAAEGSEPEVVAAVRQAANEAEATAKEALEYKREVRRRADDSATIHTMLDGARVGSGPLIERVRVLIDAWRLRNSAREAAIQEAVEGRAAAEAKLEALRCPLGPGFKGSSAETCAVEISRLVALADAVREIVGGPADAETLRAKFEETSGDIPRMLSAWLGFEVKRVSCSGDGWAALATAFDETRHGLVVDRLEQRSDSFGGERSSLADMQVVRPLKISG